MPPSDSARAPAVLYVDDEQANLRLFRRCFEDQLRVVCVESGAGALDVLGREDVGVIVSDQRMPGMTGVELLEGAASLWPDVTRVLLTAYSDRDLLLSAIERGHVHDYVLKPWDAKDLGLRLEKALDAHRRRRALRLAERERDALREELDERVFGEIVGLDTGLGAVAATLDRVARTDSTVMLRGESGTGKELLAREIHRRSLRAGGPFVCVNCAALAAGVLESELFGHEAGAFTGARTGRAGRFERAGGGTLFLDEIGDVPLDLQVKLLRVIQEREVERVGGARVVRVDFRLVAATHRNLEEMVGAGRFREDLFFRVHVVPVHVPPLRARKDDVPRLAGHFLAHFGRLMGKRLRMTADASRHLAAYDWPGNVRELRNVVERAAALADPEAELDVDDFVCDFPRPSEGPAVPIFEESAAAEAAKVRDALRQARGSKARAARLLGVPRTTLNDRIRRLGIE